MAFVSEIEAVSLAGVFQRCCAIDEKHGIVHVVFLTKFAKERVGESVRSHRFKL
ncbi:hypothetical protein SAMN05216218_1231, partial [Halorientalis regularis]